MAEALTVKANSRGVVTRREARRAESASRVRIDAHARKIAAGAFHGFRNMREVEIPASVLGIGKGAFRDCTSLERVVIPHESHLAYIDEKAFCGCCALREFQFPNRLHNIGPYAFQGCSALRRMSMSQMVEEIGVCAFSDVPVFTDFFDAVQKGCPSSDVLRAFQTLMRGVPNDYSLRSVAFSWPKCSFARLTVEQVADWSMSDFDQLLDVLAAMPFYASGNPKSPVGCVERVLLRFMGKKMPRAKRARILRHLMIEQRWPAWSDTLNRADRQWEQEQEWDWTLLPDAFCDNEDFRHWCAERNPPPWHDFKMSVRQENKGMMEKMVACAEKNEWANFLLLADVCGPDTVRRVFCQCVVDRNDEAVAGIVRACARARIQLSLRELAFECIGWGPKDAIEILKAIEESAPGMCAALYDRFDRGLLWYSTYLDPETLGENGFNPFSRQNALAQFLLQCGCDPARENVNGLAWEDLVDA